MRLLIFLKFILVLALVGAGVLFLLNGLGVTTPIITYHGSEARDVPAGIVLVVLGILLARFWKIRETREVIAQTKIETQDGKIETTKIETRSGIRFMPSTKPPPEK